jgi:hypothetical protein
MSETGAALETEAVDVVPDAFTLIIKPEFIKRRCSVAWRAGRRMGVHFT